MTVAPCSNPYGDGGAPARAWDVATWVFGPRSPYRVNTFYRCDSGAVVTATGAFTSATAASDLGGAVRWFDRLAVTVLVDVCHAVLGDVAVRTLVAIADRRAISPVPAVVIAHADPDTARRIVLAGGARLLTR